MNKQMDGISNFGMVAMVSYNLCCIVDMVPLPPLLLNNNPKNNEPANRYMVNKLDGERIFVVAFGILVGSRGRCCC